jgi:hypothetical protein
MNEIDRIEIDPADIPEQPDIGFRANASAQLPTKFYRGKPLAALLYNESTRSGGVLDLVIMAWVCWSPMTAAEFAAAAEVVVQELREREDGKLAALNG